MTKLKRRYTYLDTETDQEIIKAAKKNRLSVSTWIKLACLEKLRALDEYRERKEGE